MTIKCHELAGELDRFLGTPNSVSKFVASGWDYWSQFWVDFAAQGLPGVCSPADEFNWTEQDKLTGLVEALKMELSSRSNEAWQHFKTHPLYPALATPPFAWAGCLLIDPKDSGIDAASGEDYGDPDKVLVLLSMANTYELGRLYALVFGAVVQKARNSGCTQLSQARARVHSRALRKANEEHEALGREDLGYFNRPGRPLDPDTVDSWGDKIAGLDFLKAELWRRIYRCPGWLGHLIHRLQRVPGAWDHAVAHRFEEAAKAMSDRKRALSALPSLRGL